MTIPPPLPLGSLLPSADTESTTTDSKYQWVQSRAQKAHQTLSDELSEVRELSNY
jgi:hypothetical protein